MCILLTDLCFGLRFGIGECLNFELLSGGSFQTEVKKFIWKSYYVWECKIGELNSNSDTNNVETFAF